MSDESRIAPGQTLHVRLLARPLNHLHTFARPRATGCAACGRPWPEHWQSLQLECERCGIGFDGECYERLTVPSSGWERDWWADTTDAWQETVIICLCRGCRS